jgi:dihydroorotase
MVGFRYLTHAEDHSLMENGAMNEGFNSTRLGLPGMPKAMEEIAIDRVVRLAELAGAMVHICHVSSGGGVDIVRRAKAKGLPVTCETAPHYWTLTDDAVAVHGPNAKMNPPLREYKDIEAIREGLQDGTIDCIATDHAPHTPTEKEVEFELAPFGIIGLETSLALAITGLVDQGIVSLERCIELMTHGPARVLDLPAGALTEGSPADASVFNPTEEWVVDPERFASKGRNCPFAGMHLRGKVRATFCDGKLVYQA